MDNIDIMLTEAKVITQKLNEISAKYHKLEDGLREIHCNFPFKIDIDEEIDGLRFFSISWEQSSEGSTKAYRLYAYYKDCDKADQQVSILQVKINWRLKLYKYVDLFAKEYASYLEKLNEELIQKL